MAQTVVDKRFSICGRSIYGDSTSASVHFELTLLHFEGLSPRSCNIGGALLCDRRFQLGMRAMTAVGRYCCKSRKSNNPKDLAKVDIWTSLLLRRSSALLRRSVIDFGRNDMVPHVPHVKRVSGSKKVRSSPQEDFGGDAFPAAQLGDVFLAAQSFQHDADLLLRRLLPAGLAPNVLQYLFCRRFARPGFLLHLRSLRLR